MAADGTEAAATASETAALAAMDRLSVAAAASGAPSGAGSASGGEASAETEDVAADWPILSLARNADDMQAGRTATPLPLHYAASSHGSCFPYSPLFTPLIVF